MALKYTPNLVKSWADSVSEYINGNSDEDASIGNCLRSFQSQMENLVAKDVWTGPAAKKNFNDFKMTFDALVTFSNSLGTAFQEAMNSLRDNIDKLEGTNMGNDGGFSFGTADLTFTPNVNLEEATIDETKVVYDYGQIATIEGELASIKRRLDSVQGYLNSAFGKIGGDSDVWSGGAADSASTALSKALKEGMDEILPLLDTCINNIKQAGINAQTADSTAQ